MSKTIGIFLAISPIFLGCDQFGKSKSGYDTYRDCVLSEIQKFSYEPTAFDRNDVELYCESQFPHEREIYNVKIEWGGSVVKIRDHSKVYTITKVLVLTGKGECGDDTEMDRWFEYKITNGEYGFAQDWDEEYKCFNPGKSRFWGIMNPEKYEKVR